VGGSVDTSNSNILIIPNSNILFFWSVVTNNFVDFVATFSFYWFPSFFIFSVTHYIVYANSISVLSLFSLFFFPQKTRTNNNNNKNINNCTVLYYFIVWSLFYIVHTGRVAMAAFCGIVCPIEFCWLRLESTGTIGWHFPYCVPMTKIVAFVWDCWNGMVFGITDFIKHTWWETRTIFPPWTIIPHEGSPSLQSVGSLPMIEIQNKPPNKKKNFEIILTEMKNGQWAMLGYFWLFVCRKKHSRQQCPILLVGVSWHPTVVKSWFLCHYSII